MATKAELAKAKIAREIFKARRRYIQQILSIGVLTNQGTLILPRFFVDKLQDLMTVTDVPELDPVDIALAETDADRIILAIDGE